MIGGSREGRLIDTFVTLADTLVDSYDMSDLLGTLVNACTELLDVSAAGLMIVDASGQLSVFAASSEGSRLVEMMQLSSGSGPCVESFTGGIEIVLEDVDSMASQWPEFCTEARNQGFRAVHAVPLRLRGDILGTLNLFLTRTGHLTAEDCSAARGLADVATIGILHERAARHSDATQLHLQRALDSRVVIEQAKGVVAESQIINMDAAFSALRSYARSNNLQLKDVAEQVVARTLIL